MPADMNIHQLEEALQELQLPRIIYYEETDSTNEQALRIAAQQAEEFTLVIAEKQTAGRGRMGRKWVTEPGSSLAFSIILQPSKTEIPHLSMFSLLGALAVCRAIEANHCIPAQVKWPNDVLLDGKKTAGILAETNWQGSHLQGLVLGIGINLLPGSVPPADELLFPATCVQAHCQQPLERLPFLAAVVKQIITLRRTILDASFLEEYTRHMAFIGQSVYLSSTAGESVSGILTGIKEDGQLLLVLDSGEKAGFPIGDLHLRPEQ
jgi:BirA family biotin operon repressor/biotin-[acetyl-CoA-carboxylase] ligase